MYTLIHTYIQTDRQTDSKTHRQTERHRGIHWGRHSNRGRERDTDRQTYRQTDRQTDSQTAQKIRQTDRQTDRQTYIHTDRQTDRTARQPKRRKIQSGRNPYKHTGIQAGQAGTTTGTTCNKGMPTMACRRWDKLCTILHMAPNTTKPFLDVAQTPPKPFGALPTLTKPCFEQGPKHTEPFFIIATHHQAVIFHIAQTSQHRVGASHKQTTDTFFILLVGPTLADTIYDHAHTNAKSFLYMAQTSPNPFGICHFLRVVGCVVLLLFVWCVVCVGCAMGFSICSTTCTLHQCHTHIHTYIHTYRQT